MLYIYIYICTHTGATICTPKSPQCGECPVAGHCSALQAQVPSLLALPVLYSCFTSTKVQILTPEAQKAEGSSVLVTDYPVKVGKLAPLLQAVAVCVLTYADVC